MTEGRIPQQPDIPGPDFFRYVEATRHLPFPTTQQKHNFCEYVAYDHGWYNLFPDGRPFYLFLDPHAGYDFRSSKDGTHEAVSRLVRDANRSKIPTREYRERFGYLAYSDSPGRLFLYMAQDIVAAGETIERSIPLESRLIRLPTEIQQIGTAHITGIINGGLVSVLAQIVPQVLSETPVSRSIDEFFYGLENINQIIDRCREMEDEEQRLRSRARSEVDDPESSDQVWERMKEIREEEPPSNEHNFQHDGWPSWWKALKAVSPREAEARLQADPELTPSSGC